MQTKVEKKNERDEFLVFFLWKRVEEMVMVLSKKLELTQEIQEVGCSTKQELYDSKICWWFEEEKDLKDDLELQEKKSELSEYD